MGTLLKSEAALDVLATISLAQFIVIVVLFISVGVIIFKFRDRIKLHLEEYRAKENNKETLIKKLEECDSEIKGIKDRCVHDREEMQQKQLEYRQQSLQKQADIQQQFADMNAKIDTLIQMIDIQHNETREIKKNELREKLLNMYHHYTSLEQNPEQEWSEIEAEVFWNLFKDYEKLKGNGFMHSIVKPAMMKLKVVSI